MGTFPIRVLVVDDYEAWRVYCSTTLRKEPTIQVIGVAADGLEAVQRVEELKPDLIVLDVGLPTLNGIEVARRIRRVSPASEILFLSENRAADVVEEALQTGASGFVLKSDAESNLLPAVRAVLQGKPFLSVSLAGHVLLPKSTGRHEATFCSDETSFLDALTQFAGDALKAQNSVIVLATESHRESILTRLQAYGVDISAAIGQGRYQSFDAAGTLAAFMVNGMPDPIRFFKVAADLVLMAAKAAGGDRPRIAACGECAPLLCAQGNTQAAIQLEKLWDRVGRKHNLDILCTYSAADFKGGAGDEIFKQICAEHTAVHSR